VGKPSFYDSLKAAASALNIPKSVLQRAKDLGCANFRSGRVYVEGLKKWIADHQAEFAGSDSLKGQKLAEEVRKLKIKNDRDSGVLVQKARVIQFFNEFAGEFRGQVHQVLENEYPTVVAGMDPPQARILGKRLADKLDEIGGRYAEKLRGIE
jgi:hypothetical protein